MHTASTQTKNIEKKWKDLMAFIFKPQCCVRQRHSKISQHQEPQEEEPSKLALSLQATMDPQIKNQNKEHFSIKNAVHYAFHPTKWQKHCLECSLIERLQCFLFQTEQTDLPMQIEPMPWAQNFELQILVDVDFSKRRIAFIGEHLITHQKVFVKIQNVYNDCDDSDTSIPYEQKQIQQDARCYFRSQGMETEIAMLNYVKGLPFLPYLLDHGVHLQSKYLVVECLGPSLSSLRKNQWLYPTKEDHPLLRQEKLFAKSHDMVCVAQQLVHRLQIIHKFDLLHKDIKPDNICFGVGKNSNQVYLVDFETAWHPSFFYNHYQTEHHIFTPYYTSPYVNTSSYHSRDELISLGYVLMSIFSPLPWYKIENCLSRSECKYMDSYEQGYKIHQNREQIKREMFCQAKDGTVKFTGHHIMEVGTRMVSFKKVLDKRSIDMYPFFVRYFDILFNHSSAAHPSGAHSPKGPPSAHVNVYRALQDHCNETRAKLQHDHQHFCLPALAFQQHFMWKRCQCTGRFIIFYKKF